MNAPTLLIGLGGKGSDIVLRVAEMVTDDQRKNISFAVFDTDINELRDIQDKCPYIHTIQTSTKQTVGEYLSKDVHSREDWFPVNAIINTKTLTEGAGQVRSISRLALESVIKAGKMEPLHEAIHELYKVEEDKVDQALRVVIVSSVAGGTGSGLILPVALYVRNYLRTRFRQSANITRGFFILPEVFFNVISSETERNNLKANAYATLRELDAFLMKGDNTLPERYKNSVKMEMPIPATNEYEEYDVRPYDFCFLFDAQNASGGKLNSFDQYLQHAATCIYAQSIGPMNKRSNSSEDNTIRKLAHERGRNRYAGAGASMLIYPLNDIKKLLAYKWAQQNISKMWSIYDNQYKRICKENAKKREEGYLVQNPLRSDAYVTQIEKDNDNGFAFAKAIYKSTGIYDNGVMRVTNRWEDYTNRVLAKISADINQQNDTSMKQLRDSIENQLGDLGIEWDDYATAYRDMEKYRQMSVQYVEATADMTAWSIFKSDPSDASGDSDFKLEKYLKNEIDGTYLHPNAMRFMIIKMHQIFAAYKETYDKKRNDNIKWFENFERSTFDDPNTDETESYHDLTDRKVSLFTKLIKRRPNSDQEEMKNQFRAFMENVDDYKKINVTCKVLEFGIQYLGSIIEAFERFYDIFDTKVQALQNNINSLYKKYSAAKGTTVRYVCASDECFDRLCDKYPFQGSLVSIDSNLAKKIFFDVLEYATNKDKPNSSRFFNDLFDKGIIGYYEDSVMKSYGTELDVDVITALEMEEGFKTDPEDENSGDVEIYIKNVIRNTRALSTPFIESPLGEPRESIKACAISDTLKPVPGDESPRAQLIRSELGDLGGVYDKDVPKNMIMFYQSYYGLRANDLSKFAPPENGATYNRPSGEYYTAYFNLISGIHPIPHRSKEICPHIDKWWHIVTKMPDLDEANQEMQEKKIYAAFFWGLVNNLILRKRMQSGAEVYTLNNVRLGLDDDDDDTMIVSNGTQCDMLYEVLDAIAIYPKLVERIIADVEDATQSDKLNKVDIKSRGLLFRSLKKFKIEEPRIGPDNAYAKSIFTLPILMKKSATIDNYYEDGIIRIIDSEIDEITKYLSEFYNEKDLPGEIKSVILDQFDLYLEDIDAESKSDDDIYSDSVFVKTCEIIFKKLYDLGFRNEADDLRDRVDEIKGELG